MNINKLFLLVIIGFTIISFTACSVFGIRKEENPKYTLIEKYKNIEIRKYHPHIIAKTKEKGEFKEAQRRAFRRLAGYIFGKNKLKQKISMTAPVIQKPEKTKKNIKIAMTAPVIQKPADDGWTMTFMMPSQFTLKTLPEPIDKKITLEKTDEKYMAVIQFSGYGTKKKNDKQAKQLLKWLTEQGKYTIISKPMFAGYDPPWTLPFFRKNEMMVEIKKVKKAGI